VALSLLLVVNAVRRGGGQAEGAIDWPATRRALSTWAAFALSIALMNWLGFLLSFALLTFYIVAVVFRRSLVAAAVTAVATALGFYLVFPVALSLALPTGLLGF